MYCESCGSFIPDGMAFCSNCGTKVAEIIAAAPQPAPAPAPAYAQQIPQYEAPAYEEPVYEEPAAEENTAQSENIGETVPADDTGEQN